MAQGIGPTGIASANPLRLRQGQRLSGSGTSPTVTDKKILYFIASV